jgi:amino acid adenylation domain-containing protein
MAAHLTELLEISARRRGNHPAVVDPRGWPITYADLNGQADALAAYLIERGVAPGDRVGVVLPKGVAAVVALFGVMKAGAAYVPVDYSAPPERGRGILTDCQIRAVIVHGSCLDVRPEPRDGQPFVTVVVGQMPTVAPPDAVAFDDVVNSPVGRLPVLARSSSDLAYILYTSGSTGVPKGVMLTHGNAMSFVDWCSAAFRPASEDRFSSHAPFHFDLSILDLYVSIKHGATLFLISEELGKDPKGLAAFIAEHRLTIWYSTPSILSLLVQFGRLPAHDCSSLRLVLFAGEVFPVKHLRALQQRWPAPAYYNLYGPTETNVCTFARIPEAIPEDREVPFPIGDVCAHCRSLVLDGEGNEVPPGGEGLLHISGPSVFGGYWNRPAENAAAFVTREGERWYNTGDVVRWAADGGFIYVGRRDRMVKRHGYRIELGEIEKALYLHPDVREAAVVSTADPEAGTRITAFLACHGDRRPSLVQLKTFAAARLPLYMSPDQFVFCDRLPRTSTDKVAYQALLARLAAVAAPGVPAS